MATPTNERRLKDSQLVSNSAALPNAGNTVNTNIIDFGIATPYSITERIVAQLVTTQSTGANSKNINIVIQDCADSNASNFANIATLRGKVIAGNAANYPSSTTNYALPPNTKRYIRAVATGEANGGDASDGTFTLSLLF